MDAFQAIVLGIVQGLTEFLPISTTAHLRIVPAFLGWDDPGAAFTAVMQLGTMAAVLLYFRHDLWRIATRGARACATRSCARDARRADGLVHRPRHDPDRDPRARVQDPIEDEARALYLIGTTLIVLGLVLLLAEQVGQRDRAARAINRRDAVIIGVAQALALVPGVSPLRRDAHRRPVPRPRARRRRALLVPAVDAGRRPLAACSSCARSATRRRRRGRPRWRRCSRSSRLRVDRVAAALPTSRTTAVFVAYRVVLGALVIALGRGRDLLAARRMGVTERERLAPDVFRLPVEKIREGYYSDVYFNYAKATLEIDDRHPRVLMQVFQRKGRSSAASTRRSR